MFRPFLLYFSYVLLDDDDQNDKQMKQMVDLELALLDNRVNFWIVFHSFMAR